MLIDHLIFAHPDLDDAVAEVEERFGVRAAGGGRHEGLGTHNRVLGLGPRTYLELLAPDPGQPEPSGPRPYGAEGVTRGGLVGWALACENIEAAVAKARARGFDPGDPIDGQRVTHSGAVLRWRITSNALTAGPVPFLISWGDTPHPAGAAPQGLSIESFRIEHPDPAALRSALDALDAQVEVEEAPQPALVATLSGPRGTLELR